MLSRVAALFVILLTACQNDGFRDRLATGCRTEPECRARQALADARVAEDCVPSTGNLIERSPTGERTGRAKAMLEKGMQQIAARQAAREVEAERARVEAERARKEAEP